MKAVIQVLFIGVVFLFGGCSSLGTTHISDGQITISIGENVSTDKRKFKHLRVNEGVEVLHRYVAHRFKKRRVRKH